MGECNVTPQQAENLLKDKNDPKHTKFSEALHSCASAMNNDKRFTDWLAQVKDLNWKDRNAGGNSHLEVPALDVHVAKAKGNGQEPVVTDVNVREQGNVVQFGLNVRPSEMLYQAPNYGSFAANERKPLLSNDLEVNDLMPGRSGGTTIALLLGNQISKNWFLTDEVREKH